MYLSSNPRNSGYMDFRYVGLEAGMRLLRGDIVARLESPTKGAHDKQAEL